MKIGRYEATIRIRMTTAKRGTTRWSTVLIAKDVRSKAVFLALELNGAVDVAICWQKIK